MQPTRLQIGLWLLLTSRGSESSRHPLAANSGVTGRVGSYRSSVISGWPTTRPAALDATAQHVNCATAAFAGGCAKIQPTGQLFKTRMSFSPQRPRQLLFVLFSQALALTTCFSCLLHGTEERPSVRKFDLSTNTFESAGMQEAVPAAQSAETKSEATNPNPLYPVVEHGKWGYMDKSGKIVIAPQYYDAYPFKEGMARVQPWQVLLSKAIRVYFIDKSGKIRTPKVYSDAEDFSEGLALVIVPGEKGFGYIDATGNMIIPQDDSHEAGGQFRESLATIKQGGQWGYMNKTGKMVIQPQFKQALRFSEGLAAVKSGDKWGYIDKSGKLAIAPQYEMAYQHVEGLAAVKDGGKWGFIDNTGKMIIAPQFEEAFGFSEGLVDVKQGGRWGYIDKSGKMMIPAKYDAVHAHFEGLAGVKEGKKWGFIDKTGVMVISPQFDEAGRFTNGLAEVKVGKKFGYIDHTGKFVWGPTN